MKSLLWVFFEKVGVTLLSIIATFWYANLLGPTGFGLAILILSTSLFVSTILENFQQYPLIAANENIDEVFMTSAIGWLIFSFLISLVLAIILFLIYGSQWWLLILLSVSYIPVSSFSRVYIADLIIKQKYKQLALRSFWGKLLGVAAGLIVAYLGYAELAIILQSFIAAFVALLIMIFSNKTLLNRKVKFNLQQFTLLVKEGVPSGFAVIEQNVKSHGLIILLGMFAGVHVSGLYALAIKLVDIPRTLIGLGFTTWATGKFHQVRYENSKLLNVFNTAFLFCCSVLIPSYIGLIAVSTPLIVEFFGTEWLEASDLIVWLALYQCIFCLYLYLPPLQVLFKTTYRTLVVNIISTLMIIFSIILLSGILGKYAPLVGMYASLIFIIPKYSLEMARALNTDLLSLLKIICGSILSACIMFFCIHMVEERFEISNLYILIAVGLITYSFSFLCFNLANIIDRKILANIKSL